MAKKPSDIKTTLKFIFTNWRLFLPLLIIATIIVILTNGTSKDTVVMLITITFLMLWLTTLFFARRVMAGEKIKFRDGLYNAMTPLVSSLMIFVVLMIQCIPIILVIIGYVAALETNLFGDMFYGSLFVLFGIAMLAISGYLVPSTVMALIAVSSPGMYPVAALRLSHEIMAGKRVQFTLKALKLVLMMIVAFVIIVGPAVLVDLALKNWAGVDLVMLVPSFVVIAMCFMVILIAVYFYIYYRKVIKYDKK